MSDFFASPWTVAHQAPVSIGEAPPTQLAIIKTPGHSKSDTVEAKGNQLVDATAKQL